MFSPRIAMVYVLRSSTIILGKLNCCYVPLQMARLENMGYAGFAIAYLGDDVQFASTSTATSCAIPRFVDYIRSVIVASE